MQNRFGRSCARTATGRTVATAVTVALGAGLVTAVAPAATAAPAAPAAPVAPQQSGAASAEAVLPPLSRYLPREVVLTEAGATGYLAREEGRGKDHKWFDRATGEVRDISADLGQRRGHSGLRDQEDLAADGTVTVTVTDLATGGDTVYRLPQGALYSGAHTADSIVVHRVNTEGTAVSMSVLRRAADGTTEERPVTGLPAVNEADVDSYEAEQTGYAAVIGIRENGTITDYVLDYRTARLAKLPPSPSGGYRRLGEHHVITDFDPWRKQVTTLDLRTPNAAPIITKLPDPVGAERAYGGIAVVGDTIVLSRQLEVHAKPHVRGARLYAIPIDNSGETRELIRYAAEHLVPAPDGSVLVAAGTSGADWAVRRIAAGADGTVGLSTVRAVPQMNAEIQGLALGGDRLSYFAHSTTDLPALYQHDLSGSGTPVIGEQRLVYRSTQALQGDLHSLGDGRSAFVTSAGLHVPNGDTSLAWVDVAAPARITETTGRYSVLTGGDGRQYIGDVRMHYADNVALKRANTAASVWGTTLWTPGKTAGNVVPYDLKTKKTGAELKLGSGCVPNDLQAVGRWLYWACGTTKAGVLDRTTGRTVPVAPGGRARLGDGFVARQDGDQLRLTDLHTGGTAPFATLPPNSKWTVDKFGGHVAYASTDQGIRIKPVDVERAPVTVIESEIDGQADFYGDPAYVDRRWNGRWQLSRPAATWSITIKDAAGATVPTLPQAGVRRSGAQLDIDWDGKDAAGRTVRNGSYWWWLTVDGKTYDSGKFTVRGGKDVPRDFNGDGLPELVTRTGGDLVAHQNLTKAASGGAVQKVSKGWKNINAVVPMGAVNNGRCDGLVVRTTAGELWRYERGLCETLPDPATPRVRIGWGFGAFDTLLPAGDLTGDGRGDLLARKPDGTLSLYPTTAQGTLASPVRLPGSFKGLTLIAPGDVTGDGHADLLARDGGGELWRFNGTGKSALGAKTLVAKDWHATHTSFAGVGDLNGDTRQDLLSRDTSGRLWQHLGTGTGTFGAPTQVGTGWQKYTSLH
ncbi:FG-GAP-like repeat-containing protein [Streptomyces sp. NPDC006798]|uniref:FG-GAP-like repeat-containing protein n=1 Tax=Streptomyces sp. NPDC006798 TaxID=3155462 RepID=UPI0033D786D5